MSALGHKQTISPILAECLLPAKSRRSRRQIESEVHVGNREGEPDNDTEEYVREIPPFSDKNSQSCGDQRDKGNSKQRVPKIGIIDSTHVVKHRVYEYRSKQRETYRKGHGWLQKL